MSGREARDRLAAAEKAWRAFIKADKKLTHAFRFGDGIDLPDRFRAALDKAQDDWIDANNAAAALGLGMPYPDHQGQGAVEPDSLIKGVGLGQLRVAAEAEEMGEQAPQATVKPGRPRL